MRLWKQGICSFKGYKISFLNRGKSLLAIALKASILQKCHRAEINQGSNLPTYGNTWSEMSLRPLCNFMFCDLSPSLTLFYCLVIIGRKYIKSLNVVSFCLKQHLCYFRPIMIDRLLGHGLKNCEFGNARDSIYFSYKVTSQRKSEGVCILTFVLCFNIMSVNILHGEGQPCNAGSINCCLVSCRQLYFLWLK